MKILNIKSILVLALVFWFCAAAVVFLQQKKISLRFSVYLNSFIGYMLLVPMFAALNFLFKQENGNVLVLFLLVLIWSMDVFAYFTGKMFGKNKLACNVSPGKSWEGFIGALTLTLMLSVAIYYMAANNIIPFLHNITTNGLLVFLPLILVVSGFTVVGDLFESVIKRLNNVKDSGNILPGHGGLLDRLDSLTAAAPIFALIWIYFYV